MKLVKDLRSALVEIDLADPNSFFHCLNYNQESGRLASVQMSIRVGSAHQVKRTDHFFTFTNESLHLGLIPDLQYPPSSIIMG